MARWRFRAEAVGKAISEGQDMEIDEAIPIVADGMDEAADDFDELADRKVIRDPEGADWLRFHAKNFRSFAKRIRRCKTEDCANDVIAAMYDYSDMEDIWVGM
jgi:hypothetical protein